MPASAIKNEIVAQMLPVFVTRLRRRVMAGLPLAGPAALITRALTNLAHKGDGKSDTRRRRRGGEPAPQMADVLRRQQPGHAIGGALLAAAHGLEFTQPFHDKRVVELALAIPEKLHVRNGRDRNLARAALPTYIQRNSSRAAAPTMS
jgi:asparagine synthase (glutamine-hydrolysing)